MPTCSLSRGRERDGVTRLVSDSLRLTVNPLKSAVDRPWNRKFLGFTVSRNEKRLKVADQAMEKLKDRVRELTRRTRGNRIEVIAAELRESLLGWKAGGVPPSGVRAEAPGFALQAPACGGLQGGRDREVIEELR